MNNKYKVTYTYKGDYSSEYRVKVKDYVNGTSKLTVKNKTRDLLPHAYGQVECVIENSGNGLYIKTDNNEFFLEYCESEALLTALRVEEEHEGVHQVFVEKMGCTCK